MNQTVNQEYYRTFFEEIFATMYPEKKKKKKKKKRPELLRAMPFILQDTRGGDSDVAFDFIRSRHYSPYMSTPDFNLFPYMTEPHRGTRLDLDSLEEEVANYVRQINFGCLSTGVRDLRGQMNGHQ